MRPILLAVLAAAVLAAPTTGRAAASFDTCDGFIDALPAVISTAGTWCLRKDLTTAIDSGSAIRIAADDVELACNGFRVAGLASAATTAADGIYVAPASRVQIRDCNVRGFDTGIAVNSGMATVVERNRVENNRAGIVTSWAGSGWPERGMGPIVVRDNLVVDSRVAGIATSLRTAVVGNTVDGVSEPSASGGGVMIDGDYSYAEANIVRGVVGAAGITLGDGQGAEARGNTVIGDGDESWTGIRCYGDGLAVANVITGFFEATEGCLASGNQSLDIPPLAP